jgi:hypothetical protein
MSTFKRVKIGMAVTLALELGACGVVYYRYGSEELERARVEKESRDRIYREDLGQVTKWQMIEQSKAEMMKRQLKEPGRARDEREQRRQQHLKNQSKC